MELLAISDFRRPAIWLACTRRFLTGFQQQAESFLQGRSTKASYLRGPLLCRKHPTRAGTEFRAQIAILADIEERR